MLLFTSNYHILEYDWIMLTNLNYIILIYNNRLYSNQMKSICILYINNII